MRIVILHTELMQNVGKDELDVLEQVEVVSGALAKMNHEVHVLPFSMNLADVAEKLRLARPSLVFNLVETVSGSGRFIHLAPALFDHLKITFTGSATEAVFLTSNKLVSKKIMHATGINTPAWFSLEDRIRGKAPEPSGTFVIKSVWEHASVGLDEDCVLQVQGWDSLTKAIGCHRSNMGGDAFAETYVDGREFNLSLLANGEGAATVLPPAEIRFDHFPEGKRKMVGYRAKWETESFEYLNTPRTFEFRAGDQPLLAELKEIALKCWHIFGLRGYARVDFRVDRAGIPWVLEVNTNPCLSPDAGFVAACAKSGLSLEETVARIVEASLSGTQGPADSLISASQRA